MAFKTISQISFLERPRALLRVDFDVSLNKGRVLDDFRIREAIPSIVYIMKHGGFVRIMAHLKRPHGRAIPALSLKPVASHLGKLIGERIILIKNPFDKKSFQKYNFSRRILLFENIRFWPGEGKNSMVFASRLAQWGDCYVNDAFANSHRVHASMVAITRFLPSYAGIHLDEEVAALEKVVDKPRRPVIAILGGAKLETKLPLIEKFLGRGDEICLGGELANSILAKKDISVGSSFIDRDMLSRVRTRMLKDKRLHLPVDVRVKEARGRIKVESVNAVSPGASIFDIGPRTEKVFLQILKRGKTILWNGPLGLIETPAFAAGTISIARGLEQIRAFKVIGGGELISCLRKRNFLHGVSHISTGGGVMLEFLLGKNLPAIKALEN